MFYFIQHSFYFGKKIIVIVMSIFFLMRFLFFHLLQNNFQNQLYRLILPHLIKFHLFFNFLMTRNYYINH